MTRSRARALSGRGNPRQERPADAAQNKQTSDLAPRPAPVRTTAPAVSLGRLFHRFALLHFIIIKHITRVIATAKFARLKRRTRAVLAMARVLGSTCQIMRPDANGRQAPTTKQAAS